MPQRCLNCPLFDEFESASSTRVFDPWDSSRIIPYQPSIAPRFEDQKEALYFYVFRKETSVELSGVFKSSFWDTLLLQESHHEPFVRHALVAIAALNKSVKASQLANLHPEGSTISISEREYAFKYYGKSLIGMQRIPQGKNAHLRQLVIAILLVFVFETIQQQPDVAFSHALIGDRLMCHFVETTPHSIPHDEGISSPATHIIESELLMTYCRFDTQMMTFLDVRSHYLHNAGKVFYQSTIDDMPQAFLNLKEATLYWEVVMRRSGHFILSTSAVNGSSSFARRFSISFPGKTLEFNAQTSIYGSPYIVPDSIFLDSIRHISDIEKWRLAITPLSKRFQKEATDNQTRTAMMFLRLYTITLRIVVQGTTFTDECQYDRFLLDFSEIVFLARKISNNLLEITNQQPAYHFHLSIVPPLFALLLRCRDGNLRREALDILRMVRYDGPWDRYMISAVGEWIMKVEETRSEDGRIPQSARLTLSRLSISMERGCAAVQCVRRRKALLENGESELEWVETIVRPGT
jgi:hypothetical protein